MSSDPISPAVRRIFIWTGPLFLVVLGIAFVAFIRFIPPPRPSSSAEQIAELFRHNHTSILIGCFIYVSLVVLLLTWASVLIVQCRRVEGAIPVLTCGQVLFAAACFLIAVLVGVIWAVAAFRPGEVSPDITRTLCDAGFVLMLFTWAPFAAWFTLIAITVFSDKSETPLYPRWVAYLNLWCGLLGAPGGLIVFFKSGPFAYDGLIGFYIPFGVFTLWIVVMTVQMLKVQARDERNETVGIQPG